MHKKRLVLIITAIVLLLGAGSWVLLYLPHLQNASVHPSSTQPLATGTHLYDIRTPEEYMSGHAEYASNWPLADLQSGQFPDVAKDAPVAIYCRSGNRSAQAKALLEKAGYTQVTDLGGLDSLARYQLKIVQ